MYFALMISANTVMLTYLKADQTSSGPTKN